MVKYLNRILLVVFATGVALYIVLLNRENATVFLGRGYSIDGSIGLFLVTAFLLGLVLAAFVASVFGVFAYFRERNLVRKEERVRTDVKQILAARNTIALGELERALVQLSNIARKSHFPDLAKLELAQVQIALEQPQEAIKTLEPLRLSDSQSHEAQQLTVECYTRLHNYTAALDAVNALVSANPSKAILEQALHLSISSGRIDDALGYAKALEDRYGGSDLLAEKRATIELQKIDRDFPLGTPQHEEQLRLLNKRFRTDVRIAQRLATIDIERKDLESAAAILTKSAVASGSAELWELLAKLWYDNNEPSRAAAAIQYARRELQQSPIALSRFTAFAVSLLLDLGMRDEAHELAASLAPTSANGVLVKARIALANGDQELATKLLASLKI